MADVTPQRRRRGTPLRPSSTAPTPTPSSSSWNGTTAATTLRRVPFTTPTSTPTPARSSARRGGRLPPAEPPPPVATFDAAARTPAPRHRARPPRRLRRQCQRRDVVEPGDALPLLLLPPPLATSGLADGTASRRPRRLGCGAVTAAAARRAALNGADQSQRRPRRRRRPQPRLARMPSLGRPCRRARG